jgi:hypothetical protein
MQDLEIPPAVEEGEADGGADGVPPTIAVVEDRNTIVRTPAAASTARPWITAIAR